MSMPKVMRFGFRAILEKDLATGEDVRVPRKRDLRFADLFARALNVEYEMVLCPNLEYGRKLKNGTFTGPIGLLHRDEVDFVPTDLAITEERMEGAHFGPAYMIEGFTFATRKPQFSPKFLTIAYPFSSGVWIAMIICLIFMCAVFYIVLHKKQSLERVVVNTFGSFLSQTSVFESERLGKRLLLLSWGVGSSFIIYSYSAVLLSFLTLPVRERGVRTITELSEAIAQRRFHAATMPGIFITEQLATAGGELQIIGEELRKFQYLIDQAKEILLEWDGFAYIAPRIYIAYLRDLIFVSNENFFVGYGSVSYRKTFCCPERIILATLRITAAGLNNKINDDEVFELFLEKLEPQERFEADPDLQLSVKDMSGAFGLLIIGYAVSVCVFVMELAYKKFQKA